MTKSANGQRHQPEDEEERLDQVILSQLGERPEDYTPEQWQGLRAHARLPLLYAGRFVAFLDTYLIIIDGKRTPLAHKGSGAHAAAAIPIVDVDAEITGLRPRVGIDERGPRLGRGVVDHGTEVDAAGRDRRIGHLHGRLSRYRRPALVRDGQRGRVRAALAIHVTTDHAEGGRRAVDRVGRVQRRAIAPSMLTWKSPFNALLFGSLKSAKVRLANCPSTALTVNPSAVNAASATCATDETVSLSPPPV